MANNPYVNKVEYAGQTIMDITGDSVTPSDVLNGVTFHDRSGAPQQGNLITHNVYDGLDSSSTSDALSANQGKNLSERSFINIYTDSIGASGSKTYTLIASNHAALIFANAGNGAVAIWAISFRNASEIGISKLTEASAYTTITTSNMSFTVSCTYAAKVKVIVF